MLDMCRFILPLSKIAYQVWRDHPFNQKKERKKFHSTENFIQQKETESVRVGGGVGGQTKFEKEGVGNIGWVIMK